MQHRLIAAMAMTGWLCASAGVLAQAGKPAEIQKPAEAQKSAEAQKPASAQAAASAELRDREGQTIGRAQLTDTPNGVLIRLNLDRAPAGERAFHIHQVGRCDPPAFESAGDHFNPAGVPHGYLQPKGPHGGDLPNVHVPKDGRLTVEILARGVMLQAGANSLLDADGSALVMHAKPDDYRTAPSGAAGDRIACGVVQK